MSGYNKVMEATLQDIAKDLNVSATTVSRSLRHDKTIHPETRARVNEAARRLGYKARVRRPRRAAEPDVNTGVLGLLLRHESLDAAHHDSNLMKMMAGIMSVADERNINLKTHTGRLADPERSMDTTLLPAFFRDGTCRALIAHGDHKPEYLSYLADRAPLVTMGRVYRDLPLDAAIADNVEGVHQLVAHLVALGHRKLSWVGSFYDASFMQARKAGFVQGCLAHNLKLDRYSFFDSEIYQGHDIEDKNSLLRAANAGVTAFVCGNDVIAYAVIQILEAAGKHVPEHVSVTGFDAGLYPQKTRHLTSIDPCFFEIGKKAARLALARQEHAGDQPCVLIVRGKTVIGDTTGSAAR
jgi:LacI family transcriptional regulator